ncbi:hypothetical protein MGYG_04736 [Nannizzia gypsea CBS 118893]|uniref:Integral membrane protein n=1 Tax=Arthroderma gypseum (strain ATCC MYA-4604 / CBS 118893) TaxID=535722 RepID=E4UWH9_ARTGP|nr:hypothetical protein MGYG_04736 [Nannizzia gypsea CBS 118893]EFR01735.1 hypothetical protein MGYG_04736 [Nannizzia gypsea CBS 118893]
MAPKGGKGGGGGHYGGGGGRHGSSSFKSSCRSGAFKNGAIVASMVFLGIFLLTFLCLGCISSSKSTAMKKRNQRKSRSLWWAMSLSLTLIIASTILFITTTVMSECGSGSNLQLLITIRTWFKNWSVLLLIGVIMVPLCKHLHQLAGKVLGRVVAISHFAVMVIMAIFLTCYLALLSSLPNIRGNYRVVQALSDVTTGLGITYNVIAFIGTCLASFSILFAVIRSSQIQNSWAKKWIFIVMVFPVLLTLFDVVYGFHFSIRHQRYTVTAFAVFTFLWNLFYTMSYLAVLYIASEGSLVPITQPGAADPNDPTKGAYAPVQPNPQQPFENVNTAYNSPAQQPQFQHNMQTQPPMSQPGFEPARNDFAPSPPPQQYYDPVKGAESQSLMQGQTYDQPAPQYQNYQQPAIPQAYR